MVNFFKKLWDRTVVATGLSVGSAALFVLQLFNIPAVQLSTVSGMSVHAVVLALLGAVTGLFVHHTLKNASPAKPAPKA